MNRSELISRSLDDCCGLLPKGGKVGSLYRVDDLCVGEDTSGVGPHHFNTEPLLGSRADAAIRLDVFCGQLVSGSGVGTPSIVRFKNGAIHWASLPRNKRNSNSFLESQADILLESASTLPVELIINAKLHMGQKSSKLGQDTSGFTVYGAQVSKLGRSSAPLLSPLIVQFTKASRDVCAELVSLINQAVTLSGCRPRKLLFFINPMAGKGEAALTYQQVVRPLLKATDIGADVMLLNGPGSMRKYLSDPSRDISQYDGIVAVGGDGTLNELMNISIFKAMEKLVMPHWSEGQEGEEALSHDLTPEQICQGQQRIGVIPAGTVNHIATSVFGSDMPSVATVHTLLGGTHLLNLFSMAPHRRNIVFGTTALFSCHRITGKTSRSPRRRLLRLASSQQITNPAKQDKELDFFAGLRYQQHDPQETPTLKPKLREAWSSDQQKCILVDSPDPSQLSVPTVASEDITDKVQPSGQKRWSTVVGTFSYLGLFSLHCRDVEHPSSLTPAGAFDLVLTDSLSKKEQLKNALKKKFSQEMNLGGAMLCRAQQAFINIVTPPGSDKLEARPRTVSLASSPTADRKRPSSIRAWAMASDYASNEGIGHSSSVGGISFAPSSTASAPASSEAAAAATAEILFTIGNLDKIPWSSLQGAACEQQLMSSPVSVPYKWHIDGDPIEGTSLHVSFLPRMIKFLAMPFEAIPDV